MQKTYYLDIPTKDSKLRKFPCSKMYYERYRDDEDRKKELAQKVDMAEEKRNKRDYLPIPLGETEDLENDEWLNWRNHGPFHDNPMDERYLTTGIGGSAVSIIFGDNPWQSKLELYHKKSGTAVPKYERTMDEEILEAGHQLEQFVALMAKRKLREEGVTDIEMWNDTIFYQHPKYPWAVVNLDRRIKVNGVPGILECKTTGNFDDIELWKAGIVPKKYEWQCRYYMATMNLDYCYICCCWGFTMEQCALILIRRDKQIERTMMNAVGEFVECCECGIEPEMQTGHMKSLANYYNRLYGELPEKAPAVELPDSTEVYDLMEEAQTLFSRKKMAEERVKQIEEEEYEITSKLMKLMGGKSTYATYRLDSEKVVSVKLKQPMHRATFDEERFAKEHPDLFQQYQTSKLNVTELKKKEKEVARNYIVPGKENPEEPLTIGKVEIKAIPERAAI